VVEDALEAARGEPCAVIVEESSQAELRFACNSTTTNGVRLDRRVTVIRFARVDGPGGGGFAAGMARRGGTVDVEDLVAAATADAIGSRPAEDAQPLVHGGVDGDFGDGPGRTDLGALDTVVKELSGAFARAPRSHRILAGFAEHDVTTTYLGLSTGLRRRHLQETGAVHLAGRSDDGARSAWAASGGNRFVENGLVQLEERVARGLDWARHRIDVPAGRHEVVLPPAAVADLAIALVDAASGRESEDGRTVFSAPGGTTRIGESLSHLPFVLRSDPDEPDLRCAPFLSTSASGADQSVFDNGLPLEPVRWIDGGVLRRLRYHRAGAARSGAQVTGPVDNLVLELPGASASVDEMVAGTERGLLLTCLWYIREVDPATLLLTGLTRDGVYVVENGKVVGAANNFRFNESPVDLLARATEVGRSERSLGREFGEWVNRTRMPALRIPDFQMSSVSQAS
jgi:predicted Zn-dependent protease